MRFIIIFVTLISFPFITQAQDSPKPLTSNNGNSSYSECHWPVDTPKQVGLKWQLLGTHESHYNSFHRGDSYDNLPDNLETLETLEDKDKKPKSEQHIPISFNEHFDEWAGKIIKSKKEFKEAFKFNLKGINWAEESVLILTESSDRQTHSNSNQRILGVTIAEKQVYVGTMTKSRSPKGPSNDLPISHKTSYYYVVLPKGSCPTINQIHCSHYETY